MMRVCTVLSKQFKTKDCCLLSDKMLTWLPVSKQFGIETFDNSNTKFYRHSVKDRLKTLKAMRVFSPSLPSKISGGKKN